MNKNSVLANALKLEIDVMLCCQVKPIVRDFLQMLFGVTNRIRRGCRQIHFAHMGGES